MGGSAFDLDFDEFGDAFTVGDDHASELEHEPFEGGAEGFVLLAGGGDAAVAGAAAGHDDDGVIGAGVAVDGDAVEGILDAVTDAGFEERGGDGAVGGDVAEHGAHARGDHACAFGDAADADGVVADGDLDGDGFGARVAGHDGAGGVIRVVAGEAFDEIGDFWGDAVHGHGDADDACGADEDLGGAEAELSGGEVGHVFGVLHADWACAGVGVAAVDDDGADVAAAEVGLAEPDWGGFDLVGGEGGGGFAGA